MVELAGRGSLPRAPARRAARPQAGRGGGGAALYPVPEGRGALRAVCLRLAENGRVPRPEK